MNKALLCDLCVSVKTLIVGSAIGLAMISCGCGEKVDLAESGPPPQDANMPIKGGCTFSSNLHFEVFLKHEGGLKWDPIGKTPSGSPLKIPRCASWTVRPSDLGLVDMNTVAREIAAKKIPGLWLSFVATDADLAHLKGLTELQLFGLWDANITDAGLAHLKGMTGLEDLNVSGTKITNAGLAHLKGLTKLRNLDLGRTRVSDAGLAHLKGLTGLQELGLWGTKTTDAGVAHLRGLTGLQELGLSGTNITDAGLAHLKGLEGLRMLSLSGANITDAGLAHLKSLKGLQVLHLQQTKVTDAGLANLKGLAGLQWLSLRDTKVTDAGLAEMRKAFPKARIYPKEAATRKYITLDLGKSVTMKLVLIPAGKFLMGSRLSPTVTAQRYKARQSRCADEHPQHEVIISKPFYMGIHEVTQAQWRLVMGTEPWDGEAYSRSSNPANCIEWNDASKFCEKLSKKTGKKVALPTEAQWEYACRARSKTVYCFGDYPKRLGDYAWYLYNSMSGKDKQRRYLNPVGRKKPNAWGLHDMHGSVNEWCSDYYSEDYYGFAKELKSQRVDPRGFSVGTRHVLRGGSWASPPDECRSAARDAFSQVGIVGVGFRVVVSAGGVD